MFYERFMAPTGANIVMALREKGFRVIQRKWVGSIGAPFGWLEAETSILDSSCRYATLVDWLYSNVHSPADGAFAVSGNSGGAAEISFALSKWGLQDKIDVAVLTGGPPLSRLDYLCEHPTEWTDMCPIPLLPDNVMMDCAAGPGSLCLNPPPPQFEICTKSTINLGMVPDTAELRANSILNGNECLDYSTRVHFILGSMDCNTIAVPMAQLYFDSIVSEKVMQYVKDAGHWVPGTGPGQIAIVDAILAGTDQIAIPATQSPTSWPIEGSTFDIEVHGPADGLAYISWSLGASGMVEVPGLGWSFLDTSSELVYRLRLDATTGKAVYNTLSPVDVAGTQLFIQTLFIATDSTIRSSNLNEFTVR